MLSAHGASKYKLQSSVGLDRSRYMSLERGSWVTDTKGGMMMGPGREQKAGDFCEGLLGFAVSCKH